MNGEIKKFLIHKNKSVKDGIRQMKEIGEKALFVIEDEGKLYGALSDGDIRRWILLEGSLDEKIDKVCTRKPTVVKSNSDIKVVRQLMLDLKIEVIPVVEDGNIIDIFVWDQLFRDKQIIHRDKIDIPVVIMAGGMGVRLDPFTRILPKPLIPIGEKPVIEIIMDRFAEYDIKRFYVSIGHKSKMIKSYFEEMNEKYQVQFIEEEKPLGTVGSLSLLSGKVRGPILVVNCDTIIDSDYNELMKFHQSHHYDLTLIVSWKHYVIPFGVCEVESGGILKEIKEKPEYSLLVNTGMYIVESHIFNLIPKNSYFDIIELIDCVKKAGYKVGAFPVSEKSWIDVGQWAEYRKAVETIGVVY